MHPSPNYEEIFDFLKDRLRLYIEDSHKGKKLELLLLDEESKWQVVDTVMLTENN